MAINYPTSLDSLTNPLSTDLLTSPAHSTQHSNVNDAVEALEAKVGADASAVTTSHDYKLGEVTGTDKAVGKTATQTLTNKTLTAPQINMGSDATGDTYYRTAGGAFARLPIGTSGQILQSNASSIPEWIANPSAADASTTVKGVVEIATAAEVTAGTGTGGTGAILAISPTSVAESGADKILKLNSSGYLPALNGSLLTNVANPLTYTNGTTTKNAADASTTQNIAHGLGKTPKKIKIKAIGESSSGAGDSIPAISETVYNGTTQSSVSIYSDGTAFQAGAATIATTFTLNVSGASGTQTGVVTFDSTNIIITWTKTSSPTGTYTLLWEAEA